MAKAKKGFVIFLFSAFILGCNPTPLPNPVITAIPSNTIQPHSTSAKLVFVTETKISPTKTLEPSPTTTSTSESIPTSDFKKAQQVQYTPAPPEKCPPLSKTKIPLQENWPEGEADFQKMVLDILNIGGVEQLSTYFDGYYDDLTNDGIRELVITNPAYNGNLDVFWCKDGKFENLLSVSPAYEYSPSVVAIKI